MNQFRYIKDKKIRIFYEQESQNGTIKHYIHPKVMMINAYVRQLSSNEQVAANAIQDVSDIEFIIGNRLVKVDMFIEFREKVYQISSVDNLEFYNSEIKIRAHEVNKKEFIGVTYEN